MGSDLSMATVLADTTSPNDVDLWHTLTGVTFTVLQDDGNVISTEYMDDSGRPQYIVLDRDLTVVYRGVSARGHAEATEMIEKLLAE